MKKTAERLQFRRKWSRASKRMEWRWNLRGGNNRTVGASSEGFVRLVDARKNAKKVAALIVMLLGAAGCASAPAPVVERAPFERCMDQLGYKFHYTSDMVRAADWCHSHDNGGIR